MIELRTGLPRNGKTLSIVHELAQRVKRWDKHPEEGRPIFCHNIPNLTLPHSPMPYAERLVNKDGQVVYVPDWGAMPDGSLVIIDEAQDCFPPRSSQSLAPPHVAWLNRHGHRGFDIIVTTQHPKLIDGAVRALVGKHRHYRRTFGWQKSIVYEWDACSDNLGGYKNAVISYFQYPKEAFSYYKSATEHTKQEFKLPRWFAIPIIGVIGCLYFIPHAYLTVSGIVSGKKPVPVVVASRPITPSSGKGGAVAPTAPASPLVSLPSSVPALGAVVPSAPVFVGCIANQDHCRCLTSEGAVVEEPEQCRESSEHVGYLVALSVAPSTAVSPGRSGDPAVSVRSLPNVPKSEPSPSNALPRSDIAHPDGLRQPEGLRVPEGVRHPGLSS